MIEHLPYSRTSVFLDNLDWVTVAAVPDICAEYNSKMAGNTCIRDRPIPLASSTICLMTLVLCIAASSVASLVAPKLRMSVSTPGGLSQSANPIRSDVEFKRSISMVAAAIPIALAVTNPRAALAAPPTKEIVKPSGVNMPLGADGYTDLGGLSMCRILNGMWQVSGGHGYEPLKEKAVSEMSHCAGY